MKKNILILLFFCISLAQAQIENFTIKNVSSNTKYQDFGVSYFNNNSVVFASSRQKKVVFNRNWLVNNQPYLELYKGILDENGDISDVALFSESLNTKFHESNVAFSKDFKTVYFSRNNYLNNRYKKDTTGTNLIQLYKAEINDKGKWINVMAMPFNSDQYQTGHPALNTDETKLYFTSDMPGSYGLTDIYVSAINADGTYGKPVNLGPNINTEKHEMFPSIDENGILYFSSNGFKDGKGGLDVYGVKLQEDKSFDSPKNLGKPINSDKDDFAFVYQKGKKIGHFSSNREGGVGDDDVYAFNEIQALKFDCYQEISGVARDANNGNLLTGTQVSLMKNNEKVESMFVGKNAEFVFYVDCKTSYKIIASKESYKEEIKELITTNIADAKINTTLNLTKEDFIPIREKVMINLNPIYFDLDKDIIRKDAAVELNRLVDIMLKYPEIVIQIGSHTDSRANDAYNLKLSNRRAISTKKWIISKGISEDRIIGQGYSETQLLNNCANDVKCSETEHQLNRRTEFVVVNPEVIIQK